MSSPVIDEIIEAPPVSEGIPEAVSEVVNTSALPLRHNFAWTLAGNTVYAGCQWAMLVILAKLGTPEIVGRFALGLAVTAPIVLFTNLQLRAVQATDAKSEYLFGDYLGLRVISTLLAMLAILVTVFVSGYQLETALVVLVIGLAKGFESISDVFYGFLQHHERMDRIAKSMMIKGPLSLTMLGVGVYLTKSVLWGSVGLAFAWFIILAVYDIYSGKFILRTRNRALGDAPVGEAATIPSMWPRWEMKTLRKLAWIALPLGFVSMLSSLNTNVPRYIIEHYFGEHDLGIFAALAYLMIAGSTVVNALGQSATPRLAQYYSTGNYTAFKMLLLKLAGIGAFLGALGVGIAAVGGQQILSLLYGPEYARQVDVFVWIMLAAGIGYVATFLWYGMNASRRFKVQTPLYIIVLVAITITGFLAIPAQKLLGAALALIAGSVTQAVLSFWVVKNALDSEPYSSEQHA